MYQEYEAKKHLKMDNKWIKRFARHYELEPFFLSTYEVKKTVEDILAIIYKGEVEEEVRETFEERYHELFNKYKKEYHVIE